MFDPNKGYMQSFCCEHSRDKDHITKLGGARVPSEKDRLSAEAPLLLCASLHQRLPGTSERDLHTHSQNASVICNDLHYEQAVETSIAREFA